MEYQPIQYQIRFIAEAFGLDSESANAYVRHWQSRQMSINSYAKALFAVPAPSRLADTYAKGVKKVLDVFGQHVPFDNKFFEGRWVAYEIRQSEQSQAAWQQLEKVQQSDILIVAAQLGYLHVNQHLTRARQSFREEEFELGVLATGCILMTHPHWKAENLRSFVDTGDECLDSGEKDPSRMLSFARSTNGFTLDARPNDLGSIFAGVATGFLC
ncbi:MAG: hypothetical protein KIH67_002230 [Candidatus Moranbacteria bacterium]|nr:hypothetical protein [Candidatus Moranbacteria bacterium]